MELESSLRGSTSSPTQHGDSINKQLACSKCRAAKVKCKLSHNHTLGTSRDPCMRCVKQHLRCEYPTRKPRRRLGDDVSRASSAANEPPASSQTFSPPIGSLQPYGRPTNTMSPSAPLPSTGLFAAQTFNPHTFFSISDTTPNAACSTSPISASFRSVERPSDATVRAFQEPLPRSLGSTSAIGWNDQVGRASQSPYLAVRSHRSHSPASSRPDLGAQPQGGMSLRQELQAVKDDLGLPITRDVSRNASPDLEAGMSATRVGEPGRLVLELGSDPYISLTTEEVAYLFNKFFECHNTCIGLLDPALHTPAYTLSSSPTLFYTLLAVTAETFHPNQYVGLWGRSKTMINQAFAAAEQSIELCQAVSLVCYWNDAEDRSGSLRLGFAIRIAHFLGLDRAPIRPLPQDEHQARLELNRERTWISLTGFDGAINGMYGGIPSMAQPRSLADVEVWIGDHPEWSCPSDIIHLVLASLVPLMSSATLPRGARLQTLERVDELARTRASRVEWSLSWLGPRSRGGSLSPSFQGYLRWLEKGLVRDIANLDRLAAKGEHKLQALWNDIYAAIDSIRELSQGPGYLFWGQNSIALHASKCGMLLTKHITMLTPSTAQSILAIFEGIRLASSIDAAPRSRKEYLARLFAGLLKISTSKLSSVNEEFIPDQANDSLAVQSTGEIVHDTTMGGNGLHTILRPVVDDVDQRLLEQSIDEFISQFSTNSGVAFYPGENVTGNDALLAVYFLHQ